MFLASEVSTPVTFFVTLLDGTCVAVLGLNWLTHYNPMIDWALRSIHFHAAHTDYHVLTLTSDPARAIEAPEPTLKTNNSSPMLPLSPISLIVTFAIKAMVPIDLTPPPPAQITPVSVSFVNAVAFSHACKLRGSQSFMLNFTPETASSAASTVDSSVDLTSIPEEYHEFADVFSKNQADTLASHQPYDLHINLEEGAPLPPGQVYSLSETEQQALQEFLGKNLQSGFIQQTKSPLGALILFVRKKDGSLQLCVDFHRLHKKDHYPLPLTKDLLDAPGKAQIYTRIDLQHAYHLVCIAKGDKWKTTFWT
jgi:hypothetical protein